MSAETLTTPPERTAGSSGRGTYRCTCGHVLRVFGGGRHRVYFEPGAALDAPVMNRVCPECGRDLSGTN